MPCRIKGWHTKGPMSPSSIILFTLLLTTLSLYFALDQNLHNFPHVECLEIGVGLTHADEYYGLASRVDH